MLDSYVVKPVHPLCTSLPQRLTAYDLQGLGELPHLELLRASENDITTCRGLGRCHKLAWLEMSDTDLNNLDDLAGLQRLQYLDIQSSNVKNIRALTSCSRLKVLNAQDTNLKDDKVLMDVIGACTALRHVFVWNCDYKAKAIKQADALRPTCCVTAQKRA